MGRTELHCNSWIVEGSLRCNLLRTVFTQEIIAMVPYWLGNDLLCKNRCHDQWQIQDLPDGRRQPQRGGTNLDLLFGQILSKNP